MDFLYLSESQMIGAGVRDVRKCNQTMENMFRLLHLGDYRLAGMDNSEHGIRVFWPRESEIPDMPLSAPGKWFTAMPAYLGGKYHMIGIKCYGANQDNAKQGLPRSILMLSLMDAETGAPIAYMSANILSAMRTGSVSGVCAKYLAPKNPKKIAIIGPGTMARYSLDAAMVECPTIREVAVLGRSQQGLDSFRKHCNDKGYHFDSYSECANVKDVCDNADIIITANSQATQFEDYPCIRGEYLKSNALVIIVSALRVEQEFINDETRCICVADLVKAYEKERGIDIAPTGDEEIPTITFKDGLYERIRANKQVIEISDIIEDPKFIRDENKIYICASGGIPTEDVAWGCECYMNAINKNIGTRLEVWDSPQI